MQYTNEVNTNEHVEAINLHHSGTVKLAKMLERANNKFACTFNRKDDHGTSYILIDFAERKDYGLALYDVDTEKAYYGKNCDFRTHIMVRVRVETYGTQYDAIKDTHTPLKSVATVGFIPVEISYTGNGLAFNCENIEDSVWTFTPNDGWTHQSDEKLNDYRADKGAIMRKIRSFCHMTEKRIDSRNDERATDVQAYRNRNK